MDAKTEKAQDDNAKLLRKLDAEGGVREVPEPQHGNPTDAAPPPPGESVLNVRTGSEASVASGTGPVLPPPGNAGGAFTRVRNADLRKRDEAEFKKRGTSADGQRRATVEISASFEGLMAVEGAENDGKPTFHAGSYRGVIPPEGVTIRPMTDKETKEHLEATGQPVPEVRSTGSARSTRG